VAPDVGSAKMARGFAKRLNASLAIIDKRRPSANVAEVVNVVGEGRQGLPHSGRHDRHGGTVTEAAAALKRLGARNITLRIACALVGAGGGAAPRLGHQRSRGDQPRSASPTSGSSTS